jgi:hypothetical protein
MNYGLPEKCYQSGIEEILMMAQKIHHGQNTVIILGVQKELLMKG